MADEQEETFFQPEEVKEIIKVEVRQVLPDDVEYNPEKVEGWIAQIQERVMKRLIVDKKPFKYICTCIIQQRNGAGLHNANGMYWENDDGHAQDKHETKSLACFTTVFGFLF